MFSARIRFSILPKGPSWPFLILNVTFPFKDFICSTCVAPRRAISVVNDAVPVSVSFILASFNNASSTSSPAPLTFTPRAPLRRFVVILPVIFPPKVEVLRLFRKNTLLRSAISPVVFVKTMGLARILRIFIAPERTRTGISAGAEEAAPDAGGASFAAASATFIIFSTSISEEFTFKS